MPVHELGLLSTLVVSLVAAFAGGLAARSFGLPPLLGYLLAGVFIGSLAPGFVANQAVANELAEVGVALLLFNIGLHFSFKDLLAVRRIVVPGAIAQVALTTLAGAFVACLFLDVPWGVCLAIGLSLAIASTAVSTRVLDERHKLSTLVGKLALGWLVVQDLIVIVALVLFPVLGGVKASAPSELLRVLGQTLFQFAGFVVVVGIGGRILIPRLLSYVAKIGSRELFTLSVIVIALGIAYGSASIFNVSLALGALFAGVVIGESDLNHHAASEAVSMQQVFTILFFVSVGMLFDPRSVLTMSWGVLALLGVIVLGTGGLTFGFLWAMRIPLQSSALVGATFAQIGEFSFVLSELGRRSDFYGAAERDLIVAVALLSIVINPLILSVALWLARRVSGSPRIARWEAQGTPLLAPDITQSKGHIVLVGYGRVGRIVAEALVKHGLDYVAIESDRALAVRLRKEGKRVVFGDSAREAVLAAAHPEHARLLIVALPDPYFAHQTVRTARAHYPDLPIVVRTHSDEETRAMVKMGVDQVIMGERETAFGLIYYAMQKLGFENEEARSTIGRLRKDIYAQDHVT